MDLRQLRYFIGIVRAGSLSRAADELHVAQSALSHHLASLEAEVGRQLLTRGPKGILPTDAGTVLYRHAEAIVRHVEIAQDDVSRALKVPSGRVSIGFPVAWAGIVGYELFARMREAYPQIVLHVVDGNSSLLRERLVNGRLDIAVLFVDQAERGLVVDPILTEELFYISADSETSPVTMAEVARRPLLVPGPGSGSQRVADQIFRQHGVECAPIGEIDSMTTLLSAIVAGIGNAILPWCALYDGRGRLPLNHRPFADAKLTRPVSICHSEVVAEAVGQISPPVQAVVLTLKNLVHELVERETWQGVSLYAPSIDLSRSSAPPSKIRTGRAPVVA